MSQSHQDILRISQGLGSQILGSFIPTENELVFERIIARAFQNVGLIQRVASKFCLNGINQGDSARDSKGVGPTAHVGGAIYVSLCLFLGHQVICSSMSCYRGILVESRTEFHVQFSNFQFQRHESTPISFSFPNPFQ